MRTEETLRNVVTWLRPSAAARRLIATLVVLAAMMSVPQAFADETAAGVWEQVNEKTGEAQSTVTISQSGGVYVGRVTTIFPKPGKPDNPVCNCQGALKGRPIKGLQIIDGMKQSGLSYSDGTILDPESGTVYNATMQLSPDGKHLTVRGYVGISAFGRSQTWNRIH